MRRAKNFSGARHDDLPSAPLWTGPEGEFDFEVPAAVWAVAVARTASPIAVFKAEYAITIARIKVNKMKSNSQLYPLKPGNSIQFAEDFKYVSEKIISVANRQFRRLAQALPCCNAG